MSDIETSTDQLVEVRLEHFPVALWARAQEHADELIREFALIAADTDGNGEHGVPHRLGQLIDSLADRYGSAGTDADRRLSAASDAGVDTVDVVTFQVPRSAADDVRQLGSMLDEADRYCLAGDHLLTLTAAPDVLRFRNWYLDEFARQLSGQSPCPWPDDPA